MFPDPIGLMIGVVSILGIILIYKHSDDLGDGNIERGVTNGHS